MSGENSRARPMLSTMWNATTMPSELSEPRLAIPHRPAEARIEPGITSGRGPTRSKSRPTNQPSTPMSRPPGSSTRPESRVLASSTSCM